MTPPPRVAEEVDQFAPEWSEYALYSVAENKPEVHQGSKPRPDDLVRYLQGVMRNQCRLSNVEVDGYFGGITEAGVRSVQRWNQLSEDGRCGTNTWACIDAYAAV